MIVVALIDGPSDGDFIACSELLRSHFEERACVNIDGLRYLIGTMECVGRKGLMVHLHHTNVEARAEDLEIIR